MIGTWVPVSGSSDENGRISMDRGVDRDSKDNISSSELITGIYRIIINKESNSVCAESSPEFST